MLDSHRKELFFSHVKKNVNNCWEWTGAKLKNKYGVPAYGIFCPNGNKTRLAHRVSWEIFYGEIIPGLKILHECDNPACVNPIHLKMGTQKDNMTDALKRGRTRTKLSIEDVKSIRSLIGKKKQIQIAKEFRISPSVVSKISLGKQWACV